MTYIDRSIAKRIGLLALVLCVAVATLGITAAGAGACTCGTGTYDANGFCSACGGYQAPNSDTNGTYLIENAGQLYWFAEFVNDGNGKANAKLTADITVNTSVLTNGKLPADTSALKQWTPIGNSANPYKGTFDGDGHTISGLFYSGSDNYVGLFDYIKDGATIRNVGLLDSCFQGSGSSFTCGGIVGKALVEGNDDILISDCYSAALLTCTADVADVGGIVGYAYTKQGEITISGCYNTGEVTAVSTDFSAYVGGIVGNADSYGNIEIKKCYNTGNLTATTTANYSTAACGGVAGYIGLQGSGSLTITSCFNTGDVTSNGSFRAYCGGLAGNAYNFGGSMDISSCFSTGKQTAAATSSGGKACTGGVTGDLSVYNNGTVDISDCYYTAEEYCDDPCAGDGCALNTYKVATKTADEFASGEVAWLLNGEQSGDDALWKQTLVGSGKMAVPGFSGVAVTYDSETQTYSNPEVVSVTISWTSMEFTCTPQYNTTTHTYSTVAWTTTGGTVTVENTGTVQVQAELSFAASVTGVSGTFDKPTLVVSIEDNANKLTATLALSGKPDSAFADGDTIGTITVTIAKDSST